MVIQANSGKLWESIRTVMISFSLGEVIVTCEDSVKLFGVYAS